MKRLFIIFFIILSAQSFGLNAEFGKDWNAAQQFYNDGDYRNAIITYSRIASSGVKNEQLYYNLGNAYFKAGELGLAVLNYERALVIDPSMEDAAYNLGVTKAKAIDRVEILPTFFLVSWAKDFGAIFSIGTWTILGIVFLILAGVGALGWRVMDGGRRKAGLSVMIVAGVFAAVSFLYSDFAYNTVNNNNRGVIIAAEAILRTEPSGNEAFKLHSATTFEFIERRDGWSNIRLTDGRSAWIADSEIEAIAGS